MFNNLPNIRKNIKTFYNLLINLTINHLIVDPFLNKIKNGSD